MKKKNQFSRSILLLLIMMFAQTALLAQTATLPAGAGTVESPYLIANLNNLYWITQNSGKWTNTHYKQTANIDASSTSTWDGGKGFSPIGNDYTSFTGGSYDGQGYSISGLDINRPSTMSIGLFGYITGATTLKNIVLKDVDIKGNYNTAALAGNNSGGLIDNCSTSGIVSGKDFHVGGLVGTHNNGVIKNSTSNCTVDGIRFAGGLAGQNYAAIENSFASGNVTASEGFGGGFIGGNYGGPVKNCYSTGAVSGGSDIGGFMGVRGSGIVTNCFWDKDTFGQENSAGEAVGAVTGKTTAEMKNKSTFTDASWDFTTIWAISNIYNNGYPNLDQISQPNGSGTPADPYLIATINDLEWLSKNPGEWTGKHYKQTADIDASSTSTWDSGKGFSPIGNNSTKFTGGSYDGQGYIISGLFINRPTTSYQAMFGVTNNGSVIKNITLTEVNITASGYVSALVANTLHSTDVIDNCHVAGNIGGGSYIGGLVGRQYAGLISNSSSACSITASADNVGGLVGGIVRYQSKISNSYATGNIISTSTTFKYYYGGLAGYNRGTITNSYATVSIDCNNVVGIVGGFIGENGDIDEVEGIATNCYSTGSITNPRSSSIGGFIGNNNDPDNVTNCFWDTETSGRNTSAGGTGKTTAQMKTKSTYTGWNFSSIWAISNIYNNGYPNLDHISPPNGSGTPADPYLIATINDLEWLSKNPGEWSGKHYKQTADIDASSTSTWDGGKGFSPIGNNSTKFTGGSYDGQGYSISGLYINRPSTTFIGLFGYITGATTLKNIVLKNVDIKGHNYTAALAGQNLGGLIDNCSTSGIVSGEDYIAGGLVGTHTNNGDNNGVIKNSTSNCTVNGDKHAGGLVGQNYAAIENSFASGNVTASSEGGGFIGGNYGGSVKNCYSTGAVSGRSDIGGFMGVYGSGTVTNCFWDTQTSDQGSSAGGAGVVGKITAEMKNKSTFTDASWDFIGETTNGTADYWNINSAINNGYPYLMWQSGKYFAWSGTNSKAVNVAANWSSSVVPSSTDNISIPNVSVNFPVISNSETLSCNNLEILSGASLTIEDGGALLVNGTVSSAGTVTHQETLIGPVYTWHLISAPTPADISESDFKPNSGDDDFYAWHQASPGTWVNYLNTEATPYFVDADVNGGDNFVAGKGYLVAYNSVNPAKSFVGTPNSGTIGFQLKYDASNPSSAGSNLLGNPYAAYIDWNKADRGLLADNFAYVYNPNKHGEGVGGYDNLNGNEAGAWLKPHAGFFVIAKNTSNNATFNFSPAMQEIKTGKKDQNAEPQKLVLKLSGEKFYEQAILSINSNSTAARDRNDAIFMGSYNPNVPQLYSITSDGVKVAINSLPTVTSGQSIALGMTFPEDGEYVFSASITGESFEQEIIYLRDTETDTYHKLDKPVVLFAEAGQTDEKYELVFGPTGIEEAAFAETKYAVAYNNNYLTILGEDGELSVELIDLNGRTLYKNNHQLAGGTLRILNTSAKGLVLLKLTNGAATEVHKVIVR